MSKVDNVIKLYSFTDWWVIHKFNLKALSLGPGETLSDDDLFPENPDLDSSCTYEFKGDDGEFIDKDGSIRGWPVMQ